jgi:hypothetical protein
MLLDMSVFTHAQEHFISSEYLFISLFYSYFNSPAATRNVTPASAVR